MKKLILTFAAVLVTASTFFSCGNNASGDGSELDSLRALVAEQQEQLNNDEAFAQLISASMDSVIKADGNTILQIKEGVKPTQQQIKDNLEAYKNVLNSQRERIAQLEASLKNQKSAHAEQMKAVIAKLTAELDAKDAKIAELEQKIANKDIDIENLQSLVAGLQENVDNLTERNKTQQETISAQTDKINEAYYIIATKKELKQIGLLTGAGLFKNSSLDMSANDVKNFKKIDIRTKTVFLIPGSSPKVLTQAPADSYKITEDGKNHVLTITNATKFWSVSKFLVVQY